MQNLHNTFLLIFFISDLIRDEKICILLSTYFSTLMRSDMVLTSDLLWMWKLHTLKESCFFFCTFEFDERDNQFFRIVSLHLFWKWKTYNCQRCTFWSSSFLKQGNIWICQYPLAKKEHLFSRIKGCFFIINVSQTKTLVFSSIMDEICWFKNNRQIYLQYIYIYGNHGDNTNCTFSKIFQLLPSSVASIILSYI